MPKHYMRNCGNYTQTLAVGVSVRMGKRTDIAAILTF